MEMIEALQADQRQQWEKGTRPSIQDYLAKYPILRADIDSLSRLICNEILLRQQFGESPRLDDYIAQFPQCSALIHHQIATDQNPMETLRIEPSDYPNDELQTPFAKHVIPQSDSGTIQLESRMFETIQSEVQGDAYALQEASEMGFPSIPGFEILSELGRGGMGVVYRAKQLSANRSVALKVVRNELLDTLPMATRASTLERFRTEAQAAARLQHDNLVSVYEIGEAPPTSPGASPLRYYAMRFVDGSSLIDIVRNGPLENRRAAQYIEPVARALQSAHDQGVLHRDLKPHNIMVERASDRPLVTDFGLAKFTEGGDALTCAGEVMGTPSYMSPEQATDAGKVTTAADQYSIGATLYHLLTGRAPFQASNIAETIRQIIDKEPVAPRQLNPAIDRDLETICLKCLQKDPARRYDSCMALAKDLQLYLAGRPIVARPVGQLERLWRWCLRNPIPASLTAAAVLLAFATLTSIIVGYRNTTAALNESESRLQRALQVVDELFTRVSEDELLNEPGMQPLRKDLLEKALKHYQYFLDESGGKGNIRDEVAASHFRVGVISQTLGELDKAKTELHAAESMQKILAQQASQDVGRLRALADTQNALGGLFHSQRDFHESTKYFSESIQTREKLVKLQPQNLEFRRLRANSIMNLGLVSVQLGDAARGLSQMEQAQSERQSILAEQSDYDKVQRDLAMGFYSLGKTFMQKGDLDAAISHLKKAIPEFQLVLQRDPRSMKIRYYLGVAFRLMGGVLNEQGKVESALQAFESATTAIQSLAAGNPDVAEYQNELSVLWMNRASGASELGDTAKSLNAWNQALLINRALLSKSPKDLDLQADLVVILGSLGTLHHDRGELETAKEFLDEVVALLKDLTVQQPENEWLKEQWKDCREELEQVIAELSKKKDQNSKAVESK